MMGEVAMAAARKPTQYREPTDLQHLDLADLLDRVAGERGTVNQKRLGKWLSQRKGRIVEGRCFAKLGSDDRNGSARRQIVAQ